MTVLHSVKSDTRATADQAQLLAPRLIGIGIRDDIHDTATLDWACAEGVAGIDALHVVHSYLPLRLEGCAWEPVSRARDARYLDGSRVVAQAVRRATTTAPGLRIAGSTIAGLPEDMLEELSAVVDVLVIGDDSEAPAGRMRISWKVQNIAKCPVVSVPHGHRPREQEQRPVTVLVDEHGLSEAAMHFGADAATRRDVTLQVSRTWESLHDGVADGVDWVAHHQEALDMQVADWRLRYPHLPIAVRIELDGNWLRRVRAGSSLLVVGRAGAEALRSTDLPPAHGCPSVVVPEHIHGG